MKSAFYLIPVLALLLHISCSTVSRPPVSPVLLLATGNEYGLYTAEILKTEGFNEYQIDSISDSKVTPAYLKQFDILILGEGRITQKQAALLYGYVKAGGNLIAFRPDKKLDGLLGIIDEEEVVKEGYIKIDTSAHIGKGLVSETIQFHGISGLYKLNGGAELASLFLNSNDPAGRPAIVVNKFGNGRTAAFTYNLPRSIVLTRQGNPEWAGEERDKIDGPTATDLFYPGPGEVQWNDPQKIAIPQADEQMRLLSHIIESFATDKKPLPRFWYFPEKHRTLFIFTIDGEDTPEADINNEILDVQSKGANATLYEIGTYISAATVDKWRSAGHEVAIHYNDVPNFANPTYQNMNTVFDTMTANFRNAYGFSPKTVRNHWVVWCSKDRDEKKQFAEQAAIEVSFGLGFDCNYYQFGGNRVYPNWMGDVGHFTGSGLPMKFADASGQILDVYQSNTQLPDETWLKENIENKSKTLIDRSLDLEYFAYINANFHTWYWNECREPGMRVLDYCKSREVPVWTAERVFEFLKMKDEATFSEIAWSDGKLTFNLNSGVINRDGLTFLLPAFHGNSNITAININGLETKFETTTMKGYQYAIVTVVPGSKYSISAVYN
jgi:hypothetical protein